MEASIPSMAVTIYQTPCPAQVSQFLTSQGWQLYSEAWRHGANPHVLLTWSEAVSCEYVRFIQLGSR